MGDAIGLGGPGVAIATESTPIWINQSRRAKRAAPSVQRWVAGGWECGREKKGTKQGERRSKKQKRKTTAANRVFPIPSFYNQVEGGGGGTCVFFPSFFLIY